MPSVSERPYAITMWDFSWLERRWPGAGYEDWDLALQELADRGYDAVRIDAYPHLVSADPDGVWDLVPAWNQTSWGAQSPVTVQPLPALLDFIRAAERHGVGVALSTWYRQDASDARMDIRTADDQGRIWVDTLRHIDAAGLLDTILYVDLCNEFPIPPWTPYLYRGRPDAKLSRASAELAEWMRRSVEVVRDEYPDLDYTYSMCTEFATWRDQDVSMLDLLEPHVWMAHPETSDYNARIGYNFEKYSPVGFDNIVRNGRREYENDAARYDEAMFRSIDTVAEWSLATGKPLYTTECWALVDYKDWPGLEWDWIMDLTARGLRRAAATGRWAGLATSNFCGPQFVGMWREVGWHRELTALIKSSPIDADLRSRVRTGSAG
ncbi:cellulase-like family protein [Microbacterium sp. DT81.1]|uniref:cellulase-like family protein n=1 Tax=Microbacterium sp. DT81.1 TaxID=3393413 RepID=UPI003CF0E4F3